MDETLKNYFGSKSFQLHHHTGYVHVSADGRWTYFGAFGTKLLSCIAGAENREHALVQFVKETPGVQLVPDVSLIIK